MPRARATNAQPTTQPDTAPYQDEGNYSYCSLPDVTEREFAADVNPDCMELLGEYSARSGSTRRSSATTSSTNRRMGRTWS